MDGLRDYRFHAIRCIAPPDRMKYSYPFETDGHDGWPCCNFAAFVCYETKVLPNLYMIKDTSGMPI
jgi:hypothetical protein